MVIMNGGGNWVNYQEKSSDKDLDNIFDEGIGWQGALRLARLRGGRHQQMGRREMHN